MPSERDVLDDTCSQQSESPPDLSALIRLYGRRWRWGMNTALHLSAEIQPSQQQCAKTVQGKGKPNGWERLYLVVTVGTSRNLNSTISQLWPFSPVLSHSCWRQRQFAEASCVDNNILGITVAIGPLGWRQAESRGDRGSRRSLEVSAWSSWQVFCSLRPNLKTAKESLKCIWYSPVFQSACTSLTLFLIIVLWVISM